MKAAVYVGACLLLLMAANLVPRAAATGAKCGPELCQSAYDHCMTMPVSRRCHAKAEKDKATCKWAVCLMLQQTCNRTKKCQ